MRERRLRVVGSPARYINRLLLFMVLVSMSVVPVLAGGEPAGSGSGSAVFVDQVGYPPDMSKWFVSAEPAAEFQVIEVESGETVIRGSLSAREDATSRQRVWRGDFSSLTAPGTYRVIVPGVGQSHPFTIGERVYDQVLMLGTRFFYLQRCGIRLNDEAVSGLTHYPCHTADGLLARDDAFNKAGTQIPSVGGWHDAGDYGKYSSTTTITAAQMLAAYELWPGKFTDGHLLLPESGNGVPDILDEARVGLDWLLTMQRPDGAVYHKLSGDRWPGFCLPDWDGQRRYIYGISTPDTGKFAAVMAMASRFYAPFDAEFAARARIAAEKAWDFLSKNGFIWDHDDFDDNGSGAYGTDDDGVDRLWAALELSIAGISIGGYDLAGSVGAYEASAVAWTDAALLGLFDYARWEGGQEQIRAVARAKIIALADKYLAATKGSGYSYSLKFEEFAWASNKMGLARGIAMLMADKLAPKAEYREAALAQLHFILGLNPLGKCFVVSLGTDSTHNPHHRFAMATGKLIPGLLAGGPNNNSESRVEPVGEGPFSYDDASTSYSSNEPAIDYNAALVFVAAAFAAEPE